MKMLKISNNEISELANATQYEFPKYATQVINLVNSNAGGTRPKVVGQMSELIKEFDGRSIDEWIEWYTERYPNAVNDATEKIWSMYETMKTAFNTITKEMIENWVKDLVYNKTYCGLKFQLQSFLLSLLKWERNGEKQILTRKHKVLTVLSEISPFKLNHQPINLSRAWRNQ